MTYLLTAFNSKLTTEHCRQFPLPRILICSAMLLCFDFPAQLSAVLIVCHGACPELQTSCLFLLVYYPIFIYAAYAALVGTAEIYCGHLSYVDLPPTHVQCSASQ